MEAQQQLLLHSLTGESLTSDVALVDLHYNTHVCPALMKLQETAAQLSLRAAEAIQKNGVSRGDLQESVYLGGQLLRDVKEVQDRSRAAIYTPLPPVLYYTVPPTPRQLIIEPAIPPPVAQPPAPMIVAKHVPAESVESPPRPSSSKKSSPRKANFVCHKCGTQDTPEWRKGPEGANTLCNRCGLRYAKERKKAHLELEKAALS